MKYRPLFRVVNPPCSRVGRSAQTAGTLLAVISLFFAAVFTTFAPGSLEERTSSLLFFGLIPAFGFYVSGHILRHALTFSCKLCEIIAARCFRGLVLFARGLAKRVVARVLDDPLSTCWMILAPCLSTTQQLMRRFVCFGHKVFCSSRRLCWRFHKAIFESSCLLTRLSARFAINVNRRSWLELRASFLRIYHLHDFRCRGKLRIVILTIAFVAALGLGWIGELTLYWLLDSKGDEPTDRGGANAVIERIIDVESNGNPNAKNKRSSATGLGQFLDETWLEMIRAHRPDLSRGRSEREILELRRDPELAREITARFAERNATMLRQRGLPVTAGTVYLAHFAGAAGAVAVLSAPENADAALVMAKADATGRTKREKIIKANPFLEHFTVADLKIWADRKMRGAGLRLTEVRAANARY
jgi:hypothetical protein